MRTELSTVVNTDWISQLACIPTGVLTGVATHWSTNWREYPSGVGVCDANHSSVSNSTSKEQSSVVKPLLPNPKGWNVP